MIPLLLRRCTTCSRPNLDTPSSAPGLGRCVFCGGPLPLTSETR